MRVHYVFNAVCYTNVLTQPCDIYTHVRVTSNTHPRSQIIGKPHLREEARENRRRCEKAVGKRKGKREQEA